MWMKGGRESKMEVMREKMVGHEDIVKRRWNKRKKTSTNEST